MARIPPETFLELFELDLGDDKLQRVTKIIHKMLNEPEEASKKVVETKFKKLFKKLVAQGKSTDDIITATQWYARYVELDRVQS